MGTVERAVFTALPGGVVSPQVVVTDDGAFRKVRVTAFVTPRVTGAREGVPVLELDAFGAWPDTVESLHLRVLIDGESVTSGPSGNPPVPDIDLWTQFFAHVVVRDRAFVDFSLLGLLTSPVSVVDSFVRRTYADRTATTFPTEKALATLDDDLRSARMLIPDLGAHVPERTLTMMYQRLADAEGMERDGLALALAERFHRRPEADRPRPAGTSQASHLRSLEPALPEFDFHEICAALADYPLLLRNLGLAVDLDVLVPRGRSMGVVSITSDHPAFEALCPPSHRPTTHFELLSDFFVAGDRPDPTADPGVRKGMLNLSDHLLTSLDVDSAGPKVMQTLANASTRQKVLDVNGDHGPKGDLSSLPALRTGGITVVRAGRHEVLTDSLLRSKDHEATVKSPDPKAPPPELWSDDVNRGWRLDVRKVDPDRPDGTDGSLHPWLSLHERQGETPEGPYSFEGMPLVVGGQEFEGYVKSTSASVDTKDPQILYTSEALAGWDGWSLAARRPGRVLTPDIEDHDATPLEGFPLSVSFVPANRSLPSLRFGTIYQLRIRTADLAGNGHSKELAPGDFESSEFLMTRWEPVPPPEVVPVNPFTEGESLLRVVLRSTRGVTPENYVARRHIVNLSKHPHASESGADWSYQPVAERRLVPPKSSQQQAERHGGFDEAFDRADVSGDPVKLWDLVERESRTFYDLEGALIVHQGHPETRVPPPATRGAALGDHRYLICPQPIMTAPYLPDHLAKGIAVYGLPGRLENDPLLVDLATEHPWPDYRAINLVVRGDGPHAEVDAKTGQITIGLGKARTLELRLSSTFGPDELALLAVWNELSTSEQSTKKPTALAGGLWTLTPWITMTLVHAVEKPLEDPLLVLADNRAQRLEGETFAVLAGTVLVHPDSTSRVDIDASWVEPRDDIGRTVSLIEDPSTWLDGASHVADFAVGPDENQALIGRGGGRDHPVKHEFGDTKHRFVSYRLTATTRFRDYFPPEITDQRALITAESSTVIDVRSSRRPDPPNVDYVVPIFGWDEARYAKRKVAGTAFPPAFRRTRRGGGLRIYLRRPWWSSGQGERLAVVLPDQAAPIRIGNIGDITIGPGPLTERLIAGGVVGASVTKVTRALGQAKLAAVGTAGRHRDHIDAMHKAFDASGIRVEKGTFERIVGEILAEGIRIIVPVPAIPLDEVVRSTFVTRWGRDPTVTAGSPSLSPSISDLLDCDGWDTGLPMAHPAGERAAVATYDPQFDADRDRWYVDIHLAEHANFLPFVRLALARYQEHSEDGLRLSEVRVGDFMQLYPTREATLRDFGGAEVHVTVRGLAGFGAISSAGNKLNRIGETLVVRAWVERRPTDSLSDLDWEPVGTATPLGIDHLGTDPKARWFGVVPVPKPKANFSYRLAINESQAHETDLQNLDRDPDRFGFLDGTSVPVGFRLLYADRIDLEVAGGRIVPLRRRRPA